MSTPKFDDPEMQEIFEGFLVETKELLDNISQDLVILENQPEDLELINKIFRSFHTIKGTSSFMGVEKITEITHHSEDILNKLRREEFKVTQEIIDVLLIVHDFIENLIDSINTEQYDLIDYSSTLQTIEKIKENSVGNSSKEDMEIVQNNPFQSPVNNLSDVNSKPDSDNSLTNENLQNKSDETLNYVLNNTNIFLKNEDFTDEEIEILNKAFNDQNKTLTNESKSEHPDIRIQTLPNVEITESEVDVLTKKKAAENEFINPKGNLILTNKEVKKETSQKEIANTTKGHEQSSETLRVDVSRVEALMNLSGELVLGRNRLAQITERATKTLEDKDILHELAETTSQIDFITSEIQMAAMRMRMVQIGKLYLKAPRIVRDLSNEFNKKIKLILKGEETEIDKGIIEELNDPLVHMIRNACDHGIESPAERLASNKPEEGVIVLDAFQEGNNIVIKISDDGKGIDTEKLKAKAIEKNLITYEQSLQLSRRDTLQLIFAPGFSTATVVSAVSGRGVGMDVVITNIRKLKGMIDIETEVGRGTTFIIKLPLTLAIIQGLLVKVGSDTYVIPLSSVEEVVSIRKENISLVNQRETIRIRTNVLPLVSLREALKSSNNLSSGNGNGTSDSKGKYVVVVGIDIHRIGLVVEELLGQQEIVIKSIGEYLGQIPGIAGSTILGDGRVIMIIDIADLIENIK
ncbi:MAG: chemotaxis protein CheA [FCB group bacterium]